MAVRTISTQLSLDGEKEFKQQMAEANRELKNLRGEMQLSEAQFKGQANTVEALTEKDRILRAEIAQQEEKVRALREVLEQAEKAYGKTDKRTDDFRASLYKAEAQLIDMNDALEDTNRYLKEAERSADGTASSIDGFGRAADDAEPSMGDFIGQLGNLKNMIVGGAIVTGIKEVAGAVLELEESTREYRQIMGTLETSSQAAGYSAEETSAAYDKLYGVLGDSQTTATTVANLQAIGLEQGALLGMIDSVTGAWSKYGDSIPIDGLAESVNETIKAGQVTGNLADVLNWGTEEEEAFGLALKENIEFTELSKKELEALTESELAEYEARKAQYEATEEWNTAVQEATTAEDKFNLALQQCKSETERAALVIRMMAGQDLDDLGRAWRDTNGDIVQANESQAKMEAAMGRLGELVSPLANNLRSLGADAIEWLTDKIEDLLPMLEGMAEMAGLVWDAITGGKETNAFTGGQYGSRSVDGSHAGGLDRVPYDGYVAQTHKDEAILTAGEAEWWRSVRAGLPQQSRGVTATELQAVTAAAVNALNSDRQSGGKQVIEVRMVVNGRDFYQETIEDLRAVEKSYPEVTGDR